jgi:hypothetical protein
MIDGQPNACLNRVRLSEPLAGEQSAIETRSGGMPGEPARWATFLSSMTMRWCGRRSPIICKCAGSFRIVPARFGPPPRKGSSSPDPSRSAARPRGRSGRLEGDLVPFGRTLLLGNRPHRVRDRNAVHRSTRTKTYAKLRLANVSRTHRHGRSDVASGALGGVSRRRVAICNMSACDIERRNTAPCSAAP